MKTDILVICALISWFAGPAARAEGPIQAHANAVRPAQGGLAARAGVKGSGSRGALAGRKGVVADGAGNVEAGSAGGFATESGARGKRSARFSRSSDGSVSASRKGSFSGSKGSAEASGSFARSADGSASGERSFSATNADTGKTRDVVTTYSDESGFNRTASCTDSAGSSTGCGPR